MGNTTIYGLVAQNISKELGDKILSKTLKPITENMTFYIKQDTGNDSVANGSQEKPFKTLQACYDYIRNNYYFSNKNASCYIEFLSAYTETADTLFFKNIINTNQSINKININLSAKRKDIILHNIQFWSTDISMYSITFETSNDSTDVLNIAVNAKLYLNNCNLVLNHNISRFISCNYWSRILIDGTLIITASSSKTIKSFIAPYCWSYCRLQDTTNINITGSINVTNGFFELFLYGYIQIDTGVTMIGSNVVGKKATIITNSILSTNKKGTSILIGTEEPLIESQGQLI